MTGPKAAGAAAGAAAAAVLANVRGRFKRRREAAEAGEARGTMALLGLAAVVLSVAALLHVWVHLQVIAVGYEISRETKRRHDLAEQQERLRIELRTRMDLAQIERVARDDLKMASPDPRAIRVLKVPAAALAGATATEDQR